MRTTSRILQSYKMRFLIISTFLAYAAGAPSAEIAQPTSIAIADPLPVALSTDSPGDIQASAIDAQVKAADASRIAADQAREARELLSENPNEGIIEANDLAKEKSEQAFWNAEEQKWQALDAMMVAQAQAEAAVARTPYVHYVHSTIPESFAVEQAMPEVAVKAAVNPDQAPVSEKQEAAVKMVETEAPAVSEVKNSADSSQVESANLKSTASMPSNVETQNSLFFQSFPQSPMFVAPFSISSLPYSQPFVPPIGYVQPNLKVVASPAIQAIIG